MEIESVPLPSRKDALVFWAKAQGLRWKRGFEDWGEGVRKGALSQVRPVGAVVLESRTPLFSAGTGAERRLQLGKIQNLRVAARALHGLCLEAGQTFSFWKQVGRAVRRRGFVEGREVREGCIIPTVGGGLCQLSNGLYDLALRGGAEILERHPHSMVVPGSLAEAGRDATVFWNYIDLRFRFDFDVRVECEVTRDELVVRFLGAFEEVEPVGRRALTLLIDPSRSCVSCGIESCFRHREDEGGGGKRAFLLDGLWPEFSERLVGESGETDVVVFPIDGGRWRMLRYRLPEGVSGEKRYVTGAALRRVLGGRKKFSPPEARAFQLRATEEVVRRMERKIPFEAEHLVVDIRFLGHLLESRALGGRSYEVWVQRSPLKMLQESLDRAALANPSAGQLTDFRASEDLVCREWEGLMKADRVVTAHAEVARRLRAEGHRGVALIDWVMPEAVARRGLGDYVYFPGPTAARAGAFEVREACRRLGLAVSVGGRNLERADFWEGVEVLEEREFPMEGARAVVLPSVMLDRPGALLRAVAAGVPVVATRESGLKEARWVEFGNLEELVRVLDQG